MFSCAVSLGLNQKGEQNSENNPYSSAKSVFFIFSTEWVVRTGDRKVNNLKKYFVFNFQSE